MSNEEKNRGAEKIEVLAQIDAETHKDERLKYCSLIDATYQKIITELAPYEKELGSVYTRCVV